MNPAAGRRRARRRLPHVTGTLTSSDLDVEVCISPRRRRSAARSPVPRSPTGGASWPAEATAPSAPSPRWPPMPAACSRILPTGSGNDFARQLADPPPRPVGCDRSPAKRARSARWTSASPAPPTARPVVHHRRQRRLRRRGQPLGERRPVDVSGTPLYVLAVLRTLGIYRPRPFRVTVDDETIEVDAWLVAVGNTRTYAGRHDDHARMPT